MRKAITTGDLAPAPDRERRERAPSITTAAIDLARAPRRPDAKGFVDTIKTSDLDENRKLKAAPVEAEKKGKAKKG